MKATALKCQLRREKEEKKPKKGSCHCQEQLGTGSSAEQGLLAGPLHLEVECEQPNHLTAEASNAWPEEREQLLPGQR